MDDGRQLTTFMQQLAYTFENPQLIEEAFHHSSFVNEKGDGSLRNNERLEFLGDAVINLAVGHLLMNRYPEIKEGDLSRMRANLVNESRLADVARSIHIGRWVQLGRGELQNNGQEKNSILADTFEAVIAAVYLDGGFDAAYRVVRRHLGTLFDGINAPDANQDYKSQLQELVQLTHREVPAYEIIDESGPDHDKTFGVRLCVRDITATGTGKSKKLAEQDAARKALEILKDR
jgi:ribonuclease-3